jgi:hypothetical protein
MLNIVLIFGICWWLRELDISLFLRKVVSPETLNGQNQSDESWN